MLRAVSRIAFGRASRSGCVVSLICFAPLQMIAIGGLESGLLRNNNTSQRRWPGSEDPRSLI